MVGDFGPLLNHVPAWLMVLFRLSGIFILAPIFGSVTVPRQVKVLLVLGLACCVYPMLLDSGRPSAAFVGSVVDQGMSLWAIIPSVALELLIGYVIGYAASIPLMGMQIGGHIIDQQIGLGIAGVINPEMQEQSGIIGEVFFMFALAVFAILGGHRVILAILIGTFDHVPLGGFTGLDSVVGLVLGLINLMFELSLRIAAPLLCLVFLETLTMGFLARTVPQLNIMSVGFSLRILIGVGIVIASLAVVTSVYTDSLREVMHRMLAFFPAL